MAKKKKATAQEVSELDSAYENITKKSKKKGGSKVSSILICIACGVLLLAIGVGVWFMFSDSWLTMDNVTMGGIQMQGKTKNEAKELLEQLVQERYGAEDMSVTVLEETVILPAAEMNISADVDAAVDAAYGKTGSFSIAPYLKVDTQRLQAAVDALGEKYNADLQPTQYTVEGTTPSLTGPEAEEGTGQTLVLQLGTPQMGLDTAALTDAILEAYGTGSLEVTAECTVIPPELLDAQGLYEKFLTPSADAQMDPTTFAISKEVYGYSIDPQVAEQALKDATYGDTLRIPFAIIVPQVTAQQLEDELYHDVLGQCSTPYSGSDNNNRNTNLGLACEKINGTIVLPGEVFSYNMTLGERTKENGWKPAASYVGGLTIDTYGGGICQGSTTLYNCVLEADFELVECYPHGYISAYVSPGLDASVNWGTADFRFKNTSNWPIKILASRQNGKMSMQILGTDEKDYYVKMTYSVLGSTPYKTVYEEVDPNNNPKKYTDGQELVSPYTGYRVVTYKNRYDKQTDELIETKLERDFTYSHRDRVVVKFVDPNAPKPGEGEGGSTEGGSTEGGSTEGGGTEGGGTEGGGTEGGGTEGGGTENP